MKRWSRDKGNGTHDHLYCWQAPPPIQLAHTSACYGEYCVTSLRTSYTTPTPSCKNSRRTSSPSSTTRSLYTLCNLRL